MISLGKWWYELYKEDPQHILIETALVCFIIWLLFIRRTVDPKKGKINEKLTSKEIDWLIDSWQPEPLVPLELDEKSKVIVDSMIVVESIEGNYINVKGMNKKLLNLMSYDFLGLSQNKEVKEATVGALSKYGCGSCGPRGFYGTIDQHLRIEKDVATFMGTPEAIAYSDGASAVSSTIPAFAKNGDLLIVDEACSEAIISGCILSRSKVEYFKHNDMEDLEKYLKKIRDDDIRLKRDATQQRRYIVSEGVFRSTGEICPLPKIVELKKEYCYRLIIDESISFGTLGKTGRGVTEHYGIPIKDIEMTVVAMDTALASVGGLCIGTREVVDHQRLSGAGYCFSASAAPFLSAAAATSLKVLQDNASLISNLQRNSKRLYDGLVKCNHLSVLSDSPTAVIQLVLNPPLSSKEAEDFKILKIAKICQEKGLGVVASTFSVISGGSVLRPSIRVCSSATLTSNQIDEAIKILAAAFAVK